jgi:zinc/manganese transport system substrate-binding protein
MKIRTALMALLVTTHFALAQLSVVASTPDLAAVAREVGGDLVRVEALCRGDQDPHDFEVLPSQVMQVQRADVYLKAGLALDLWADKLISSAGNGRLQVSDCSRGIAVIGAGVQDGPHPLGNPHYWLGPSNDTIVARTVERALQQADPSHAGEYAQKANYFVGRLDSALTHWRGVLAPCSGWGIVSSHPSWDYFARDFGLEIVGTVSRVPDAEPSPLELATLESAIRGRGKAVFLREPFTSARFPDVLARDTRIPVLDAPSSVGASAQAPDLWSQFEFLTAQIAMQCQTSR